MNGTFSRSFTLPEGADAEHAATGADGDARAADPRRNASHQRQEHRGPESAPASLELRPSELAMLLDGIDLPAASETVDWSLAPAAGPQRKKSPAARDAGDDAR